MSAVTAIPTADGKAAPSGDRLRIAGLGFALVVGPWLIALADAVYAVATRDGGGDIDGASALALAGAHGAEYLFASQAAIVGSLLMVAAAVGASRALGQRASKLGLIAAVLVGASYVGGFATNFSSGVTLAMAEQGGPTAEYAKVLDASQGGAFAWVTVMIILGNMVGTLLLGIALWRSRVVPTWAAILLIIWLPLHVIGLIAGSEWFAVAGMAATGVAFAMVARALSGRPRG